MPDASPRVDFFVIGAQKAGTTALTEMLRRHPQVEMARDKEVHHFDRDATDWSTTDHARLHVQFDWTRPGVIRGEATPAYVYWPAAMQRLYAYNPDARLILGLRHPAFRAHSHWRMQRRRNSERLGFAAAVTTGRRRVAKAPGGAHLVFSYVERGFYAPQIRQVLALFPRTQLLVYRVDTMWTDPATTLARIEDHLGLARCDWSQLRSIYTVPIVGAGAKIAADVRAELDRLFRADLFETEALTDLDLSEWRRPDYTEPMAPPA